MKTELLRNLVAFVTIATLPSASGQFSSGSNGAMNITTNTTLQLPPNGVFHCTTINIATGATLRFAKNSLNTPVYLLATSDVTINGRINVAAGDNELIVAGEGGPGGFDGGLGGSDGVPAGDGYGPGAGRVGKAANSAEAAGGGVYGLVPSNPISTNKGSVYGNSLLVPLIGGSGGGGMEASAGSSSFGGGGGGGALLIASSTRIDLGTNARLEAYAPGATGNTVKHYNRGSGGAIRLVAPTVAGSGTLDAGARSSYAGHGRIRIDSDQRPTNFTFIGRFTYGREKYVSPPVIPLLSVVKVAHLDIPEHTNSFVQVQLQPNNSTNQIVRLRARDFAGIVPISVIVTPRSGKRRVFQTQLDMASSNPAEIDVEVQLAPDMVNTIHVWAQ